MSLTNKFSGAICCLTAVGFTFAFFYNIDPVYKILHSDEMSKLDDNGRAAKSKECWNSIKGFYNSNQKECAAFHISTTVLFIAGKMYDGTNATKILALGALAASIYSFTCLNDAFEKTKPATERLASKANNAVNFFANKYNTVKSWFR